MQGVEKEKYGTKEEIGFL